MAMLQRVSISVLLIAVAMTASFAMPLCLIGADSDSRSPADHMTATVNSLIETFTAWWTNPSTGETIIDGATVALTDVALRGYSDPLAEVTIFAPLGTYSLSADGVGFFEQNPVSLKEGLNVVTVTTTNSTGANASIPKIIVSDTHCMLWIADMQSPTAVANVEVKGWTDVDATVTANDGPVSVSKDGTFAASVTLVEGTNEIYVNATDSVGNTNRTTIQIVLDTSPPDYVTTDEFEAMQTALVGLIDKLTASLLENVSYLQGQIDNLHVWLAENISALQNLINGLNQTTQGDIGDIDERVSDTESFTSMLMYLMLILFAITVVLIGVVWHVMSARIGGGGGGGPAEALEEVEEGPSEVEREFERLEKEIMNEEM